MITEANMDRTKKAYLNGLFFTFLLVVYIHLTACLWFFVLKNSKTVLYHFDFPIDERELEWVPPFWFNSWTSSNFWTTKDCTPVTFPRIIQIFNGTDNVNVTVTSKQQIPFNDTLWVPCKPKPPPILNITDNTTHQPPPSFYQCDDDPNNRKL